ncbi:GGDEF domain-containing protein [Paraburkholderia tropica]|uniref:GGDEF domain-containing protein n=1 Tax=Paraburkholderia tropica TaxID=92647 RepID=UPI0030189FF0
MRWAGAGDWHGPTVIKSYQNTPEREQAVFRSILGSAALIIYFAYSVGRIDASTRITLEMMALYVGFGFLTWLAVSLRPTLSPVRLTVTTITDQSMAITALALGGRAALPLLFIIFWFLVGTGCRYGKRSLILSCSIAVLGIAGLMAWQSWWSANRQVGVGLLLAVISTSFYLYVLVNKLERRAATDPLTGLLNRRSFAHLVDHVMSRHNASREQAALLLIDLDGFKEINDVHGHGAGDELLEDFAQTLVSNCRKGDAIARLGGDEFVIFARNLPDRSEVEALAKRIHSALSRDDSGASSLPVSASIGVYMLDGALDAGKLTVTQILQKADRAMYQAKSSGRGKTVFADGGDSAGADQIRHAGEPV